MRRSRQLAGSQYTPRARTRNTPGAGVLSLLPFNSRVAQIGDSIINAATSYTVTNFINSFVDIVDWANVMSGSRLYKPQNSNKGIGGQTSTQIATRYTTDLTAINAKIVVANGGINDGDGVSAATILANWDSMIAQAAVLGHKLIAIPIYQWSGESVAQAARRPLVNAGLLSRQNANFKVADITGFDYNLHCYTEILGGGAGSKIHPNLIGARLIAASVSSIVNGWVKAGSPLLAANDPLNKAPNGYLTGTAGSKNTATGNVADNYSLDGSSAGGATVIGSKIARPNGGFWQQVAISGTYTGNGKNVAFGFGVDIAGFAAGDLVELTADIEVDGGAVNIDTLSAYMLAFTNGYETLCEVGLFRPNVANGIGYQNLPAFSGVFRVMPLSIPSLAPVHFNVVQIIANLREGGAASPVALTFRVGSIGLKKL